MLMIYHPEVYKKNSTLLCILFSTFTYKIAPKKAEIYVCSAVKNNSVKKSDVTDFTQIVHFCQILKHYDLP